eukprot:m.334896 g.334896  ORF g.334896 m.334896 type:complete len:2339 (-) comp19788_c0_seq2:77-7093(-)
MAFSRRAPNVLLVVAVVASQVLFAAAIDPSVVTINLPIYSTLDVRLDASGEFPDASIIPGFVDNAVAGLANVELIKGTGYTAVCADTEDDFGLLAVAAICNALGMKRGLGSYAVTNTDSQDEIIRSFKCDSSGTISGCTYSKPSSGCFRLAGVICEPFQSPFESPVDYVGSFASSPADTKIVDFDGDGDDDIVVASGSDVSWFEAVGNGFLASPKTVVTVRGTITHIVVSSFTGPNAEPDIIVATDAGAFFWAQNHAAGSVGSPVEFDLGLTGLPTAMTGGHDGNFAMLYVATDSTVHSCGFDDTPSSTVFDPCDSVSNFVGIANHLLAMDVTDDGLTDVIAFFSDGPKWAHRTGPATFDDAEPFVAIDQPRTFAQCDLNNDTFPDIVVTSAVDNKLEILYSTSGVNAQGEFFFHRQNVSLEAPASFVACGNFGGDTLPDLAVVSDGGVSWLVSQSPSGADPRDFGAQQTFADATSGVRLSAGRFAGLGRDDLVFQDAAVAGSLQVLRNDGSATAFASSQADVLDRTFLNGVEFGHTESDGFLDEVFQSEGIQLAVRSTLSGRNTVAVSNPSGVEEIVAFALGDVDGDGLDDAARLFTNTGGESTRLDVVSSPALQNTVRTLDTSADASAHLLAVADIAGSDEEEVIVVDGNTILVFEPAFVEGSLAFDRTELATVDAATPITALATALFDTSADAKRDVVVADASGSVWRLQHGSPLPPRRLSRRSLTANVGQATVLATVEATPTQVHVTHVNTQADTVLDLVVTHATGLVVLPGDASAGAGEFAFGNAVTVLSGITAGINSLVVQDVNNDGAADILVATNDRELYLLEQDTVSAFAFVTSLLRTGVASVLPKDNTDIHVNGFPSSTLTQPPAASCPTDLGCVDGRQICMAGATGFCTECVSGYHLNTTTGLCQPCEAIAHCDEPICETFRVECKTCDSQFELINDNECLAPIFGQLGDLQMTPHDICFLCLDDLYAFQADDDVAMEILYFDNTGLYLVDVQEVLSSGAEITASKQQLFTSSEVRMGLAATLGFADIDGDGIQDIYGEGVNEFFWIKNFGNKTFTQMTNLPQGSNRASGITVADFDQDGFPDLVLATAIDTGRLRFVKGLGNGTFESSSTVISSYQVPSTADVYTADFNGDDIPDFVFRYSTTGGIAENDGTASFSFDNFRFGLGLVYDIGPIHDFDNDGYNDLMICGDDGISGRGLYFVRYAGPPPQYNFDAPVLVHGGQCTSSRAGDFDNDGLTDVAIHTTNGGNLKWVKQMQPGVFGPSFKVNYDNLLYFAITTGDFDGDGDIDIVNSAGQTGGYIQMYRNDLTDALPPTVTCPAGTIVLELETATATNITVPSTRLGVSAIDNVALSDVSFFRDSCIDGGQSILDETTQMVTLARGDHTLCVRAEDLHNNVASCSLNVTVVDTVPPVIAACIDHHTLVIGAGETSTVIDAFDDSALAFTDNIEAVPGYTWTRVGNAPGVDGTSTSFDLGRTLLEVTVVDNVGNQAKCNFAVTVLARPVATEPVQIVALTDEAVQLVTPALETLSSGSSGSGGEAGGIYTMSLASDSPNELPTGLQLEADTGALTGTPQVGNGDGVTLKLTITDRTATDTSVTSPSVVTMLVTVKVAPPLQATRGQLLFTKGHLYTITPPSVSGGFGDFAYAFDHGNPLHNPPPGLTMDPTTGIVSGIPTTTGEYSIIGVVTDVQASIAESFDTMVITVYSELSVAFSNIGAAQNVSYDVPIGNSMPTPSATVTGGRLPVTYSLDAAVPGISIDPTTGALTGVPNTYGDFSFNITATDANGAAVVVNDGPMTLSVVDCAPASCGSTGSCVDPDPTDGSYECLCSEGVVQSTPCLAASSSASSSSASFPVLLGSILGACLLLVLLVIVFMYRRLRRADRAARQELAEMHDRVRTRCHEDFDLTSAHDEKFRALEIPRESIAFVRTIGSGNFGTVDEAKLQSNQAVLTTAVKRLTKEADVEEQENFLFEARLMSTLEHHAIVQVVGVCSRERPFWLCLEYVQNGDLKDYIKKCNPAVQTPKQDVGLTEILACSRIICDALVYLKTRRVVHRDLAARNVLVGESLYDVKLADFGMSRALDEADYYKKTSNDRVPVKWLAPESMSSKKYSFQSDVWSFGVLVWEVLTYGESPYPKLTAVETALAVATGYRLSKPKVCPMSLYKTLRKMWEFDPERRLPIEQVLVQFKAEEDLLSSDQATALGYVDFADSLKPGEAPPTVQELAAQAAQSGSKPGSPSSQVNDYDMAEPLAGAVAATPSYDLGDQVMADVTAARAGGTPSYADSPAYDLGDTLAETAGAAFGFNNATTAAGSSNPNEYVPDGFGFGKAQ